MPVAWNVNAVWRNHIIVSVFIVLFCPWPFLTLFLIAIFAFPLSEWDEEFIGTSFDEALETYLGFWNFTPEKVSDILKDHDKFLRIQLQLGQRPQDRLDFKNDMEYLNSRPPSSGVRGYTQYNKWDEPFDGLAKEEFDWVLEIIEICKEEWAEECQALAYLNDLGPDAIDVWAFRHLGENFTRLHQALDYSFPFKPNGLPRKAAAVFSRPFELPIKPKAWGYHLYAWQQSSPILNLSRVKVMIDDVGRQKFRPFVVRGDFILDGYMRWQEKTRSSRNMKNAGQRSWRVLPYVHKRRKQKIWKRSLLQKAKQKK